MAEARIEGGKQRGSAPPTGARFLAGGLLALITVAIWALWIVSIREAVTDRLPLSWVGMLRYAVPALVLLPWWWRIGLWPRGVDRRLVAFMVIGAGAPFLFVVAAGMRHTPVAEVGVLLPGTMPLFVAVLAALFDRERFTVLRLVGFALVIIAMLGIGGTQLLSGERLGALLLPVAALLWAIYTIAYRRAGIDAVAAAGIIAAWSAMIFLPFAIAEGIDSLLAIDATILAFQFVTQAVLSGIVALVCYGAAIRILGSSRAAVFSALAPALAALLAVPILGEMPTPLAIVGVVLAVAGVALGSGAVGGGRG